ncbi:GlxA family transcriptional regulator [Paracoccus sanguinis]|uniref:GlxA family transcriptional regulator n=1 Tax=Paracoccus sanguinis TaxID=1545044 RepID=UPI00051FA355|nr:helix-turn-helix domain-containing protein [Paracoccus sanguinis]KGJ14340.1 AraC family transcriptional regulator [Paracoccus sanguinis]KGJ21103.1 AraC family transcriptional regulator [Paracoccus sanguinis]
MVGRGGAGAPRLNVAFVLARRFTLAAYANFVDVLRLAADEGDRSRPILCRWAVLGTPGTAIRASCGTRIEPDTAPENPAQYDYVVVIGGLIGAPQPLDPALGAFVRRAAAAGVPLAGVCTGVFILARAGLMAGRDACVSWFHHDEFQAEFGAGPGAGSGAGPAAPRPVSDRTLVVDGDRLSCSGGVSAAQLAALLVDRHIGRAAARKALAIMMIDTPGGPGAPAFGDQPQPGMPLELSTADPLVRRALMILQQRLDSPPTVAALAAHLGVGRRRLERHFAAALGLSPAAAAMRLRLAQARMLIARGDAPLARVADATGFCDASHLIRVFRDAEGQTPDRWRRQPRAEVPR